MDCTLRFSCNIRGQLTKRNSGFIAYQWDSMYQLSQYVRGLLNLIKNKLQPNTYGKRIGNFSHS